ncbi:uncharacterized protein LOC129602317 [Paramacrobiotus metropolitanus]|uniref:uncharacterized protein LOC129602317 n=1 Tax=Paramacrobiotus metropolitanus TaxID=2943436 RepID=UPI0024456016|nr:uncharacterized protein LOC129602317 [Paramacrobiotus metropolitanus]
MDFVLSFRVKRRNILSAKGNATLEPGNYECIPAIVEISGVEKFLFTGNVLSSNQTLTIDFLFHTKSTAPTTLVRPQGLSRLAEQMRNILKLNNYADFKVISADNVEFSVHRAIIAAQSSVFATMFSTDMSEKSTGTCKITDITGNILEAILEFLYGRTVSEELKKNAEEILVVASRYELEDLRDICGNLMVAGLTRENAERYLKLAVIYELKDLKKQAAKIVANL